jgi:hypothetical protein
MKKTPDEIYKKYVPFLKQKEILSNLFNQYLELPSIISCKTDGGFFI